MRILTTILGVPLSTLLTPYRTLNLRRWRASSPAGSTYPARFLAQAHKNKYLHPPSLHPLHVFNPTENHIIRGFRAYPGGSPPIHRCTICYSSSFPLSASVLNIRQNAHPNRLPDVPRSVCVRSGLLSNTEFSQKFRNWHHPSSCLTTTNQII